MPTLKQKKAVENLVEHGGSVGKAMRDAGYSPATAKTPQKLTEGPGYQEAAKPFLDKLEAERNRILEAMATKDLEVVAYNHLSEALVRTNHDMQLLGGKPTEIIKDDELD